jgi:hypothetical protein
LEEEEAETAFNTPELEQLPPEVQNMLQVEMAVELVKRMEPRQQVTHSEALLGLQQIKFLMALPLPH